MLARIHFWTSILLLGWVGPRSAAAATAAPTPTTAPTTAQENVVDIWNSNSETNDTWQEFPPELQDRLEMEQDALIFDHYAPNGHRDRKVHMTVYQVFPESTTKTPSQRVWPLLQGMLRRMKGILAPHVVYYLQSGDDFGCRGVDSDHCQRHCSNQGRYCAHHPQEDVYKGRLGRDVVLEVMRRLCLVDAISSYDARFTAYLQEFERYECFVVQAKESYGFQAYGFQAVPATNDGRDVISCSLKAMASVGVNVQEDGYEDLRQCMQIVPDGDHNSTATTILDLDQEHPLIERNLQAIERQSWNRYSQDDMPQIEVDQRPIMPEDYDWSIREWSSKLIFQHYCDAFPFCFAADEEAVEPSRELIKRGKPLACEVCSGCKDVQTCLWTLQCDGEPALEGRISQKYSTCGENDSGNSDNSEVQDESLNDSEEDDDGGNGEDTENPINDESENDNGENNSDGEADDNDSSTATAAAAAGAPTTTTKKKRSLLSTLVMLVLFVASGYVTVMWYRRRLAKQRDEVLKRSIPAENFRYSDDAPLDDTSIVFAPYTRYGKSAREKSKKKSEGKNLAPRPSEDRDLLHEELQTISLDDIYTTPRDGTVWV